MKQNPIVIIGSGLAGYTFAKEFRKLDDATPLTIITESDGCFYSKPLLSTALTNKKTPESLAVYDADAMASQLNAKIHTHTRVNAINPDEQVVLCEDQKIRYSHLVLACGAKSIQPPLEGNAATKIPSVNDLESYAEFRTWIRDKKNIAILGSGLVGCEFANDLLNAGYKVEVISPDVYPLGRFVPEPVGLTLKNALADRGIKWRLGRCAKAVDHVADGYRVTLDNDDVLNCDGVFSAIGLKAACELAGSAGIKTNFGIVVDRRLRTNMPNVYALGDCAEVAGEVKQYVAPLLHCSRVLASSLAGGNLAVAYPVMPVVVKTSHCPVVTVVPPVDVLGKWRIEGEGADLKACFYDQFENLHGFALSGNKVKQRQELMKALSMPEYESH